MCGGRWGAGIRGPNITRTSGRWWAGCRGVGRVPLQTQATGVYIIPGHDDDLYPFLLTLCVQPCLRQSCRDLFSTTLLNLYTVLDTSSCRSVIAFLTLQYVQTCTLYRYCRQQYRFYELLKYSHEAPLLEVSQTVCGLFTLKQITKFNAC